MSKRKKHWRTLSVLGLTALLVLKVDHPAVAVLSDAARGAEPVVHPPLTHHAAGVDAVVQGDGRRDERAAPVRRGVAVPQAAAAGVVREVALGTALRGRRAHAGVDPGEAAAARRQGVVHGRRQIAVCGVRARGTVGGIAVLGCHRGRTKASRVIYGAGHTYWEVPAHDATYCISPFENRRSIPWCNSPGCARCSMRHLPTTAPRNSSLPRSRRGPCTTGRARNPRARARSPAGSSRPRRPRRRGPRAPPPPPAGAGPADPSARRRRGTPGARRSGGTGPRRAARRSRRTVPGSGGPGDRGGGRREREPPRARRARRTGSTARETAARGQGGQRDGGSRTRRTATIEPTTTTGKGGRPIAPRKKTTGPGNNDAEIRDTGNNRRTGRTIGRRGGRRGSAPPSSTGPERHTKVKRPQGQDGEHDGSVREGREDQATSESLATRGRRGRPSAKRRQDEADNTAANRQQRQDGAGTPKCQQ